MKKKILVVLLAGLLALAIAACGELKTPGLTIESTAITSITVTAVDGAEYSKDGGTTWQDSNKFEGLTAATDYSITIRMKATTDKKASNPAAVQTVRTLNKEAQTTAPPLHVETITTIITVTAVPGAEYRLNDGEWQTSNKFEGLTPDTEYTVAIRFAETAEKTASPITEAEFTTAGLIPLDVPVVNEYTAGASTISWAAVTSANRYIVTVDRADGGKMGGTDMTAGRKDSSQTIVRLANFPFEIEVSGTTLAVSKLPYDCDLAITVRASNTSAEYSESGESARTVTLNRGNIFTNVTYNELELRKDGTIFYYANFRLVQDVAIPNMSAQEAIYTRDDAIKAYTDLYYGTDAEKETAVEAIGNDVVFILYESTETELSEETVYGKNKFWDGYLNKHVPGTPGSTDVKITGRIGINGYTVDSSCEYRTAKIFETNTGTVRAADYYGKTITMEIGILLDGFYYGCVTTVTLSNPAA